MGHEGDSVHYALPFHYTSHWDENAHKACCRPPDIRLWRDKRA